MQAFSSGNEGFSHQSKSEGFDNLRTAKSESKKNQIESEKSERKRDLPVWLNGVFACERERERVRELYSDWKRRSIIKVSKFSCRGRRLLFSWAGPGSASFKLDPFVNLLQYFQGPIWEAQVVSFLKTQIILIIGSVFQTWCVWNIDYKISHICMFSLTLMLFCDWL